MVILGFTSFEEPFKWAETFTSIPNYVDTDNTAVKKKIHLQLYFQLYFSA